MAIKTSSAKQIEKLIGALSEADTATREAAVARLTVIGARAVERLISLVESTAPSGRSAALRVLEAIADPRALDVILRALNDPELDVAVAAAGATRPFVLGSRGSIAIDRLAEVAVNPYREAPRRLAALRALAVLEPSTVQPLWTALLADTDEEVRTLAEGQAVERSALEPDVVSRLRHAAERGLSEDPQALRDEVARGGARAALGLLHRLIERVRDREAEETSEARRAEWMRVHGTLHLALASRGSRLALYDLREMLESAGSALPVEFLSALSAVGDASSLETIASVYIRSASPGDDWWRRQLGEAFRAIVDREQLTRRHAAIKKLATRWPAAVRDLLQRP